MDRLTVSLDNDSEVIVDSISKKYGLNKTGVIRKALKLLDQQEKLNKTCSTDTIQIYCKILSSIKHSIKIVQDIE